MDGTPGVIGSWANMKTNEKTNEENRNQKPYVRCETPGQWRARLSPSQQMLAQQIAGMIEGVTESKRIEIRKELGKMRARFIHILKQPEEGCLSAIMLPEVSPAGWN
jgi:hypothetical protein